MGKNQASIRKKRKRRKRFLGRPRTTLVDNIKIEVFCLLKLQVS
jgi:hypothetical protein